MILGDLKRLLSQLDTLPNDAEVVFTPSEYCGEGFPQWDSCWIREYCDKVGRVDNVEIMLRGERE